MLLQKWFYDEPVSMNPRPKKGASSPRPSPPQVCGGEGDGTTHNGVHGFNTRMGNELNRREAGADTFRGSRSSRPPPSASRRRHRRADQLKMVRQELADFESHVSRRDAGWSDCLLRQGYGGQGGGRAPQSYSYHCSERAAIRPSRMVGRRCSAAQIMGITPIGSRDRPACHDVALWFISHPG